MMLNSNRKCLEEVAAPSRHQDHFNIEVKNSRNMELTNLSTNGTLFLKETAAVEESSPENLNSSCETLKNDQEPPKDNTEEENEPLDFREIQKEDILQKNCVQSQEDHFLPNTNCVEGEENNNALLEFKKEDTNPILEQENPQALDPDGFNLSKQDYRLDFTEVEGTLAEIPEETQGQPDVMMTADNQQQLLQSDITSNINEDPLLEVSEAPPDTEEEKQAGHHYAQFHIPESNASEFNFSECSSFQYPRNSFNNPHANCRLSTSSFIRSSEPLTAKQQVALWLTKTSMTDMSSMPSLRSLIFPSSHLSSTGATKSGSKPNRGSESMAGKSINGVSRNKSEIHRNFSTKSLINGYGLSSHQKERDTLLSPDPIRKCETVMALSGLSNGTNIHPERKTKSIRSRKSSLNLFKRLTRRGGGSNSHTNPPACSSKGYSGQHRLLDPSFGDAFGGSGCDSPFKGIRPINRLRSNSSMMMCSHCTSFNNSRMTSRVSSQMSLAHMTSAASMMLMRRTSTTTTFPDIPTVNLEPEMPCKICLVDTPLRDMMKLQECGCHFCKECMHRYISMEILQGAYDISCPDMDCEKQGILHSNEMELIVGKELMDKHLTFRLNLEVSLDKNRAWCPRADCGTICHVCNTNEATTSTPNGTNIKNSKKQQVEAVAVNCPNCEKEFCSLCSANWHPGKTCQQNGQDLVQKSIEGNPQAAAELINYEKFDGDIKPCPMCRIPIERDEGCAQMMCKKCKHVFCWFCQTSLDDDFLLRHYDSGACKGRLGHSRISVLWHRAQVIGIFAGFGILLLAASPLFMIAAPCILCCWCKMWEKFENQNRKNSTDTVSEDQQQQPEQQEA